MTATPAVFIRPCFTDDRSEYASYPVTGRQDLICLSDRGMLPHEATGKTDKHALRGTHESLGTPADSGGTYAIVVASPWWRGPANPICSHP